MLVTGYYNHTFPTINGIRGTLCSYYPFLGENDYSEHDKVNVKLLGFPEVLNRFGYDTALFTYFDDFYTPNSEHIINMRQLLAECGFKTLYMGPDIQRHLLGVRIPMKTSTDSEGKPSSDSAAKRPGVGAKRRWSFFPTPSGRFGQL